MGIGAAGGPSWEGDGLERVILEKRWLEVGEGGGIWGWCGILMHWKLSGIYGRDPNENS